MLDIGVGACKHTPYVVEAGIELPRRVVSILPRRATERRKR